MHTELNCVHMHEVKAAGDVRLRLSSPTSPDHHRVVHLSNEVRIGQTRTLGARPAAILSYVQCTYMVWLLETYILYNNLCIPYVCEKSNRQPWSTNIRGAKERPTPLRKPELCCAITSAEDLCPQIIRQQWLWVLSVVPQDAL